jgi:hypothetical protein
VKLFSVLLVVWLVAAFNCPAQLVSHFSRDRELEDRVERLLERREVGELANELALVKAAGTEDLLLRLSVFARAGHRDRVLETLRELAKIYPSAENQTQIFRVAQRAINADDLPMQRMFYEQIAVYGDERTGEFIRLWSEKGDAAALEKWLRARAAANESWWIYWLSVKKSRGAVREVADELAQQIRANPSDFALVRKYLQVVTPGVNSSVVEISPIKSNIGSYEQDVSWLAGTVQTDSAYTAFELAIMLKEPYPALTAKLLLKSLALDFTERDRQMFAERVLRSAAVDPNHKNTEKQLRVWTKQALVEIYQKTNQAMLAQPIVEELTTMDMSDIQPFNAFYSAGAVQSSTGLRVVEAKILKDEKQRENSPEYWLNRAAYYEGRREKAEVWNTYLRALEKFAYQPNDYGASLPRLQILYTLKWYGKDNNEKPTSDILRNEFIKARAKNDFPYLFQLLRMLSDDFEELHDEFFVNTDLLPEVLAARAKWSSEEIYAIGDVMESKKWDAKKRDFVWNQLAELARRDVGGRAFMLANAMSSAGEERRAIPLLEECLKIAPPENDGSLNFDREDVQSELFDLYVKTGDWQKAEKLWRDGLRASGSELNKIAAAAAKQGKIADALRVWKIAANFDRRDLRELDALAKTEAKTPLREFYSQMKTADALSDVPDKALLILQ